MVGGLSGQLGAFLKRPDDGTYDVHTLLLSSLAILMGYQSVYSQSSRKKPPPPASAVWPLAMGFFDRFDFVSRCCVAVEFCPFRPSRLLGHEPYFIPAARRS